MKTNVSRLLARQYARAFINVFGDQLDLQAVVQMRKAATFLRGQHGLLFFLSLPALDSITKYNGLLTLIERFGLLESVAELMRILLMHKRAALLPEVLKYINHFYKTQHHIMPCTITSSHMLTDDTLAVVEQFLAQCTNCSIIYTYKVDKALIAGIRAQSATMLWEHSIRKQLARARTAVGK